MLKLTELLLSDTDDARPSLQMQFSVVHNVGALKTTLETDWTVRVNRHGRVNASLVFDGLEAESLDAAREKLAVWCDRTAAALRGVDRVPCDVPVYERRLFDVSALPAWLQREYAVLAERYKRTLLPDVDETRQDIRADLVAQGHPLVYISGAIDCLENHSYPDE